MYKRQTIDVAYRYFSTPKRKFIIADTPGHEEYTRNMFTGASNSSLAIILIDSRKGVLKQSRRHLYISYLLGIKNIIVAVNKMDLVDYSREKFLDIRDDFLKLSDNLSINSINFIPISALKGDMIVDRGINLSWYKGDTLIHILENTKIYPEEDESKSCFPVQLISRVDNEEVKDFRGYMGMVTSGKFKIGDKVKILPAQKESKIGNIIESGQYDQEINKGRAGTLLLEDELEISRGDVIASLNYDLKINDTILSQICWMGEKELKLKKKYIMKHSNKSSKILINKLINKINIESLKEMEPDDTFRMNDIGQVEIKIQNNIVYDTYESNKELGSFIIIDIESNNTVAAGIIK